MIKQMHYVLTALMAGYCFTLQASPEQESLTIQAREHATALGKQLTSTLQNAMKQGGPEEGVKVCHEAAMPIAQALSKDGWQVGRTSLRVRNPENSPDDWEREQLTRFASALSASLPVGPLEATQWDEKTQTFRYMKAIQTKAVCTRCHGVNIATPVEAVIRQHYPQDNAIGFRQGELRGAFTLTKRFPEIAADSEQ